MKEKSRQCLARLVGQVRELKIQRKIQAISKAGSRQVRELKIQRKNPGSAFRVG